MAELHTADQWWAEFARIKDHIKEWGPEDFPIRNLMDNPFARSKISKSLWAHYEANQDKTFWAVVDQMEKDKDRKLLSVLGTIWEDAPDQPYIHQWRSWRAFCDLCSEGPDCLYPEHKVEVELD